MNEQHPNLEDGPPDSESGSSRITGARHLIAIGGGRGGVGKSLVATNLAVHLAQLGKSVVLVDADPTGSNLHAHFGLRAGTKEPSFDELSGTQIREALVPTLVPGLSLLPAAHDSLSPPIAPRVGRKGRWLARLRALPVDYLVIDVGPGHGHFAVDVMLHADLAITVTAPEPPAVEAVYRFIRATYRRRVRRALVRDRLRLGLFERVLREIGSLPVPLNLVQQLSRVDKTLGEIAWSEAQRLSLHLVVNQTRVRSDTDLGAWMSALSAHHYGVRLDELGHIEHDDTVWLTVRRNRPLLIDSPTSKAGRNLERIARRVLTLSVARPKGRVPSPIPTEEPTLYAVLGITRTANDEEVRRAFKRQREVYAEGSVATSSLFDAKSLQAAQGRLSEAYETLLDPVRRRAYDLSTFHEPEETALAARPVRAALTADLLAEKAEIDRMLGPDTEFTGALLRRIRESRGIELVEISGKTKISRAHLVAIEEERHDALPAFVYCRGFLGELAKFLELDVVQVQRSFLRRLREAGAFRKEGMA